MTALVAMRAFLRRLTWPAVRWMWQAPEGERVQRRPRLPQVTAACALCGREIVLFCRTCCREISSWTEGS